MSKEWELYKGKPKASNFTDEIMKLSDEGLQATAIARRIKDKYKWQGVKLVIHPTGIKRLIDDNRNPPDTGFKLLIVSAWNSEGLRSLVA